MANPSFNVAAKYEQYLAAVKCNQNVIHAQVHANREKQRLRNEANTNAKRRLHIFQKDDIVRARDLIITAPTGLKMKYTGPLVVHEVSENMSTATVEDILLKKPHK